MRQAFLVHNVFTGFFVQFPNFSHLRGVLVFFSEVSGAKRLISILVALSQRCIYVNESRWKPSLCFSWDSFFYDTRVGMVDVRGQWQRRIAVMQPDSILDAYYIVCAVASTIRPPDRGILSNRLMNFEMKSFRNYF